MVVSYYFIKLWFQAYSFKAAPEQLRAPRVVKVGLIQNSIVLPTSDSYAAQREAIMKRVATMIESSASLGVNIVCLQVQCT